MIKLPEEYLHNMKELLQDEYDDYLKSFEHERYYALRINTSKISVEDFMKINHFDLSPVPWTDDGFYFDEEKDKPSKHPYYYAGLYYLQEPSAMLPAEVLELDENDIVLDACAAPGGKALKLANKLHNTGTIIANDISVSRAQILLNTLQTGGIPNAYVMANDIAELKMEECFDAILIDAPCSGEGMFRKEPSLIKSWLEKGNDYYADIQKKIIEAGIRMLKDGGRMVYSTCTFNPKEDEEIIEYALSICPELKVLPIKKYEGFSEGITDKTKNCVRLYPHKINGEGHFVAYLQKGDTKKVNKAVSYQSKLPSFDFFNNVNITINQYFEERNGKYYLIPYLPFDTKGLRIIRSGLLLGETKKERFEPSEALAMALSKDTYHSCINLKADDHRVIKYLKCETIETKEFPNEGYTLVLVDNYPLGFGIIKNGILKNKYPANHRYQ
ncbi:MAG: RsmB/NOP family class I SAM-dependent RNA methyltransferase [Erysipelotrichaceae bacterium]|nr:RsmB/NOP family class I SAM-dependent RNA methyltransferase [Erysipelotrichaceae bacterium]